MVTPLSDILVNERLKQITYDNDVNFIEYIVSEHRFIYINMTSDEHVYEFDDAHFLSSFHPSDRHNAELILQMMINGEDRHFACECRYYLPRIGDFSWEYVDVNVYEKDADGKVLKYLAVCRSTDKWHELNENLQLFRKKVQFITKVNGVVFVQYDVKKHIFIRLDNAGENAYHLIPLDIWKQNFFPEDIRYSVELLEMLDKHKVDKFHTEYRYKYPDDYHWFSVDIAAYEHDEKGEITSYLCIVLDIDERKKSMMKMEELRRRAEAANKMKELFIEQLSHEIRTPLNCILGFSELMSNELSEDEYKSFKGIIKDNANQLLQIVNDTINISSIEAGFTSMSNDRFHFREFFRHLCQSMRVLIRESVQLECIEEEDFEVETDNRMVTEIINAFVANANKFTKQGEIVMRYARKDNGLYVSVSDTGIGIKAEDQERIFERFEKLDTFTQGMGMGLAICKALVTRMNGKIGVQSELDKGSTFWFWIPCKIY